MNKGCDNPSFIGDSTPGEYRKNSSQFHPAYHIESGIAIIQLPSQPEGQHTEHEHETQHKKIKEHHHRDNWGKSIEFLMSCIAMSVGLGNIWRFPFTALENGGGAFVIPYLIVLFLVGKPCYLMEMILGQFSSRGSVKVFDFAPIMRGVGVGQVCSIAVVATYYASIMALTLKYLYDSFSSVLPWSVCDPSWNDVVCIPSGRHSISSNIVESNFSMITDNRKKSSAELYFSREVLKEKIGIDDGLGSPDLTLLLFLALSWMIVFLILIRGVKSSGKASYVLALFPYFVLSILLVRALTLPGAWNGIVYFLKPQWDQLLNPRVWYAAITQVFFSLSVCFGNIVMYSSYNKFTHNVHRDATIVTSIDTFTSLLAGCTIFGILGHLAHEINTDDISQVVKGGTGLAFISYPDAIAKFETFPQAFSVLFFLMLYTLGIGSNIAMMSCVMTVIRDQFPKVKNWHVALLIAIVGICLGSVYVTPGGQYILKLVDFFGASFITFVMAIAELIAIGWIYGVPRFCKDTEFMLGFRPNLYWRLCWRYITPGLMIAVLVYSFVSFEVVKYEDYVYPDYAYIAGWCITALGLSMLPLFAIIAVVKQKGNTFFEKFSGAFQPKPDWGPRDPVLNLKYKEFLKSD